jgi:hypothetical protein
MKASFVLAILWSTLVEPALGQVVHSDVVKVINVPGGVTPGSNWADSYSVGKRCYCESTFDHDIGPIKVNTPLGVMTVRDVCDLLGSGPGSSGRPKYNDIQCGNGPANNLGDEDACPGRIDIGVVGCGQIGPMWNFSSVVPSQPTFPNPQPVASPALVPTISSVVGRITGFRLFRADMDTRVSVLASNSIIDVSVVGTQLTIRAKTRGPIGSIRFRLDNNSFLHTENAAPFALGGHVNSDYIPVPQLIVLGAHKVYATPYSGKDLSGTRGTTVMVTFSVIN